MGKVYVIRKNISLTSSGSGLGTQFNIDNKPLTEEERTGLGTFGRLGAKAAEVAAPFAAGWSALNAFADDNQDNAFSALGRAGMAGVQNYSLMGGYGQRAGAKVGSQLDRIRGKGKGKPPRVDYSRTGGGESNYQQGFRDDTNLQYPKFDPVSFSQMERGQAERIQPSLEARFPRSELPTGGFLTHYAAPASPSPQIQANLPQTSSPNNSMVGVEDTQDAALRNATVEAQAKTQADANKEATDKQNAAIKILSNEQKNIQGG